MCFLKKLWQAMLYSFAGLKVTFKEQWAFRAEVLILFITIPVSFFVGITVVQRILLVGSILLVLIIELINSAIETTVNRISMEQHELSGRAKDIGSAAVFVACVNAVIVWIFILISNYL